MAAQEVIQDKCGIDEGEMVSLDGDLMAYFPKKAEEEIGYSPHSPENESEREEAIEACMRGSWAEGLARGMLGKEASQEAINRLKRKVCRGLYD